MRNAEVSNYGISILSSRRSKLGMSNKNIAYAIFVWYDKCYSSYNSIECS
jgi:hypothetical protein